MSAAKWWWYFQEMQHVFKQKGKRQQNEKEIYDGNQIIGIFTRHSYFNTLLRLQQCSHVPSCDSFWHKMVSRVLFNVIIQFCYHRYLNLTKTEHPKLRAFPCYIFLCFDVYLKNTESWGLHCRFLHVLLRVVVSANCLWDVSVVLPCFGSNCTL